MKKNIFFGMLLLLLISSVGKAGDWYEMGNGGFMITCPGKPQQILDLYELENRFQLMTKDPLEQTPRKMTADLNSNQDRDQRVNYLLAKIARINPSRARLYTQWYKTFFAEAQFLPDIHLNPIPDLGLADPERNCNLQEVVFQREPSVLNQFRYTIDKDLWSSLSQMDQAALIMHELIYREMAMPPSFQQTSEESRYLNALVNSVEIQTMSTGDYLSTLQTINVPRGDYQDLPVLLSAKNEVTHSWMHFPLTFSGPETPGILTLDASANFRRGGLSFKAQCPTGSDLMVFGVLYFQPDGGLPNMGSVGDSLPGVHQCLIALNAKTFNLTATTFSVDPHGKLVGAWGILGPQAGWPGFYSALVFKQYAFVVDLTGQPVSMAVDFDANQEVKKATFTGHACFDLGRRTVNVTKQSSQDSEIVFTSEGLEKELKALPRCSRH